MMSLEILDAAGLSIIFMGILLGIVTFGIMFFIYKKTSGRKRKEFVKMGGLILAWAVYIALNMSVATSSNYNPIFLVYSLTHLISIFIGTAIIIVFLFLLPKLWKIFDKKLLITAGIFAGLSLLLRIINPFIANDYLSLIQRVLVIIPSLSGLFMIIKSDIENKRVN